MNNYSVIMVILKNAMKISDFYHVKGKLLKRLPLKAQVNK